MRRGVPEARKQDTASIRVAPVLAARSSSNARVVASMKIALVNPDVVPAAVKSPTAAAGWIPSVTSVALAVPLVLLYWQLGTPSALLTDPNTGVHVRTGEWTLTH